MQRSPESLPCFFVTLIAMGCALTPEPVHARGAGLPVANTLYRYVPVLDFWSGQDKVWPNLKVPFEAFQRILKKDPFFLEFEGGGIWMDAPNSLEEGAKEGLSLWRAGIGVRLQKRMSALFGWGSLRDGLYGKAVDTGAFVTISMDFRF